jgi:hypothetical protein
MHHSTHADHDHIHNQDCGHTRVQHGDHVDYLHDGCLHAEHEGHYDEHAIAVDAENPAMCSPIACSCGHSACEHELVPHGDHVDYLHEGRLHHPHGDHCDDHGALKVL